MLIESSVPEQATGGAMSELPRQMRVVPDVARDSPFPAYEGNHSIRGRRLERQRTPLLVTSAIATALAMLRLWSQDAPLWYFWVVLALCLVSVAAVSWAQSVRARTATRVSVCAGNLHVQVRGVTDVIPLRLVRLVEVGCPAEGDCRLTVSLMDAGDLSSRQTPISFVPRGPRGDRSAAQSVATLLRRAVAEAKREASLSPVSSHSPVQSRVVH